MANYLLEMRLAEELTFTEIRLIRSALKKGDTIIGYLTPEADVNDPRMKPQKFQFLSIDDNRAEIIWLPWSRDGKPYSTEEIPNIPQSDKALLTSKQYKNVNDHQVVAEARYKLEDLKIEQHVDFGDMFDDGEEYEDDEEAYLAYRRRKRRMGSGEGGPIDEEAYEIGTDEYRKHATDITPGQKYKKENKSYYKGLSKSTAAKRKAAFKADAKKDSDKPSSYRDSYPGDARAKTRTSKHTKAYHKKFGESTLDEAIDEKAKKALQKKAEKSGIAYGILKQVYNRGLAAWKSGHRPGANQQQWGYARVNSFITGGKTRSTADKDLWQKHKGKKESVQEGENHSWKSTGHYTADGEEWLGPQHAHNGQVMTGEKHTDDSVNLYHFKDLAPEIQKKVLSQMNEHGGHDFQPGDAVTIPDKDLSGVVLSQEKDDLYKIQLDGSDKITMAYADNMRWVGPMRYESLAGLHVGRVNQIRYERSHGKPAKGKGQWSFSVNRYSGDDDKNDVVFVRGTHTVADAANLAVDEFKKRGKKIAKSDLYVMESIEEEQLEIQEEAELNTAYVSSEWLNATKKVISNKKSYGVRALFNVKIKGEKNTDKWKYGFPVGGGYQLFTTFPQAVEFAKSSVTSDFWGKESNPIGPTILGPKNESLEFDGVESDGEAEEMLARIKSRAADRKDSESFDRPESESKTRPATKRVLQHRAIRLARNLVFKKESGGKAKSELLFPERLRIEKIVASQKDVVMDLARQLYPIIDQKEQDRNKPI